MQTPTVEANLVLKAIWFM